ncbi:lysozyme inhibitor LprI family protein [Delftia sp. PS-11]|uniref:lysozyme inhibitor LprI family protein n=1 Tax=Delftia sp. PS-11 TaxID=2767222 RepID=UPI002455824B|nr:lysozyme inhibitor LprI family protein [Delftia sp. PS-11]KAJ8744447.1 DUF1311 domain-containing protein [Delftia sp. PS-11]
MLRSNVRKVAPLALVLGSCAALASPCDDRANSMPEVRACLAEQNESSVQAVYASLSAKLRARMPRAFEGFETAQKSWAQFARDTCDFHAEFNAASVNRDDARIHCQAELARTRVKLLRSWEMQLDKRP